MRFLVRYAIAVVAVAPLVAGAASVEELRAQVQQLLERVNQLQQSGVAGPAASCPQIGRSLKRGSSGEDVSRLQQFLARDIAIYPEGLVTGYYGALTEAAVRRWQAKFNIVSSGDAATTGYGTVGPRTAAAIAIVCSGGSVNNVSAGSGSPVGGFIQVSPISGAAPLTVTVQATVNTTNSCTGAVYTLDFGDGVVPQQINVPQGLCTQMTQSFPHTYLYGGVYLIKLSAAGHQTTATVVVSGNPGPGSGGVGDSIAADKQSGTAPLSVTFTGIVNAGASCNAGAYTLDFGDGQTAQISYPATCQAFKYSSSHTFSAARSYTVVLKNPSGTQAGSVVITAQAPPYSYSAPTISPDPNNPRIISVQFGLPTGCTGYSLSWGDNSAASTQSDSSSCAATPVTKTLSHTYGSSGTYTIVLTRGGTRTDTASIVISSQ